MSVSLGFSFSVERNDIIDLEIITYVMDMISTSFNRKGPSNYALYFTFVVG